MLSLLAYGLIQAQGGDETPFPVESAKAVAIGLGNLGYRFTPSNEAATYGELTHNGETITAQFYVPSPYEKVGAVPSVERLRLNIELGFPSEIPLDPEATDADYDPNAKGALFIPHLGKTVSVFRQVDLAKRPTLNEVRTQLDRLWKEVEDYVKAHGGFFKEAPVQDWSKVKFRDDLLLRLADETSLARLTASWGWTWRQAYGFSSNGWTFPIDVKGTQVWLHEDVNSPLPRNQGISLNAGVDLPKTENPRAWSEKKAKVNPELQIDPWTANRASVRTRIDLGRGTRLHDLRKRIEEFARKVAALQKSVGPPTNTDRPKP